MAKIFKFSGYLALRNGGHELGNDVFQSALRRAIIDEFEIPGYNGTLHQFHTQESELFKMLDGEFDENCDLALLERHFKHNSDTSEFDRPLPQAGQKYRHFKIGKIVEVIGISRHTENQEWTVVYKYEDTIWNRPLDMFMSEVEHEKYPDVAQKYRFELIEV